MTILRERVCETRQDRGTCRSGRLSTDEVLAVLVHDLRSPLGAMQNALRILQLSRIPDPAVGRTVGVMERQLGCLGRLIGDLLDRTRVTTGKIELRQEWLDLETTVALAVEACRPLIEQNGHQLSVFVPRQTIRLRADPARLQQILVNLLTNSAKYTDPGGRIWLIAQAEAGGLVVRVRDNGIGIAADLLPRIFDLFQQGPGPKNRGGGGLGIGLALVQWLVELHGGSITAHSDGLGKGSEFVVRMPESADSVVKGSAARPGPASLASGCFLIHALGPGVRCKGWPRTPWRNSRSAWRSSTCSQRCADSLHRDWEMVRTLANLAVEEPTTRSLACFVASEREYVQALPLPSPLRNRAFFEDRFVLVRFPDVLTQKQYMHKHVEHVHHHFEREPFEHLIIGGRWETLPSSRATCTATCATASSPGGRSTSAPRLSYTSPLRVSDR